MGGGLGACRACADQNNAKAVKPAMAGAGRLAMPKMAITMPAIRPNATADRAPSIHIHRTNERRTKRTVQVGIREMPGTPSVSEVFRQSSDKRLKFALTKSAKGSVSLKAGTNLLSPKPSKAQKRGTDDGLHWI